MMCVVTDPRQVLKKSISLVTAANERSIFQHRKRDFVYPGDGVIFLLLYEISTTDTLFILFQKLWFDPHFISKLTACFLSV